MSRTPTQHLTDAELSDLLAGEQPGETTAQHLAACDHCSAELLQVRQSLSSFSEVATGWAETVAPARVPVPSRWALGLTGWPTLATGAAVTALTGLLVFNFGPAAHTSASRQQVPTISAAATVPSKTELADDNRLMLSIDEELNSRTRPAMAAADLRSPDASSLPQAAVAVVN